MAATYPWWRALTVRQKIVPESTNQEKGTADMSSTSTVSKDTSKSVKIVTEDTFQEDEFEPRFNQQTCRRNLRISRSGRFKEKRRGRAAIPESGNFHDGNVAMTVAAK